MHTDRTAVIERGNDAPGEHIAPDRQSQAEIAIGLIMARIDTLEAALPNAQPPTYTYHP